MSKARDLINAHLYPVLATVAVIYGVIQFAPIAQQARSFNHCTAEVKEQGFDQWASVAVCNGR